MKRKKLLFVCTGNICRSPMAEYLLKTRLGADSEWDVCSAGICAPIGMPASTYGVEVMGEKCIDMSPHKSQRITAELIDESDVIVVMTLPHKIELGLMLPGVEEKTFLLKSFSKEGGGDLDDPIGSPVETYRAICDEIDSVMPELMDFLKKLEQ